MSVQVIWTPKRVAEFIEKADLVGIEAEIIRIRHHRYGRIKDCEVLADKGYPISPEGYDKIIRNLKHMYDLVQPESSILPPRAFTKSEAYQNSAKY